MSKALSHVGLIFLCFSQCTSIVECLLDPISLGIGGGAIGLGIYGYDYLREQTYCRLNECCNERSIPGNIRDLDESLKSRLFGQHIVRHQLIPALTAHFNPYIKPRKPLVISFHGTPGTGKNFVADLIAESLYAKGVQSKYVHKYLGRADFPVEKNADIYKERINAEVHAGLTACPRSLFIFDEVDKMPAGIFESITSLLDYNTRRKGQDYAEAIFIFLSNTAGVQISNHLGNLIKSGTLREHTKLSDFEQTLEVAAYNLEGGLNKASLIDAHVIDHYIPFLPLEKPHVIKCIEAAFLRWNRVPNNSVIEAIYREAIKYDREYGLFATSGCKTLEKKVAVQAHILKT